MRINRLTVWGDVGEGRFYLILVSTQNGEGCNLYDTPARTNVSHEERLYGWLGSTNNVSRTADGMVDVYRDAKGALRARRVSEDDARAAFEVDANRID